MKLLISIQNKKIKIILLNKKKEVDFWDIEDEYRLSEDLLPSIDKLLKKNKLLPKDIKKLEVKTDQNDNFTTTRIAKTVANTWNKFNCG